MRALALAKHPSMRISVRPAASAEDLACVAALRESHRGPELRSRAMDALDARSTLLLVTVAGSPAGTARIVHEPGLASLPLSGKLPPGGGYLEVGKLVVASAHRHTAVSAAIAMEILDEADRRQARGIALDCIDTLVPYYTRLGFRAAARDPSFQPPANLMLLDDVGFPTFTVVQALIDAVRPRRTSAGAPADSGA